MVHHLDKVIEIAKKLRKLAKKVDNQDVQSLIVDLNLSVADLKMQVAEAQQSDSHQQTVGTTREQRAESTTTTQDRTLATSGAHPLAPTPMPMHRQ